MNVQPVHVLVVEDNLADVELIQASLAENPREPFVIETTGLLETALQVIREDPPDIVLLDLRLPDSTGVASCEQIHRTCPVVPIVVLTGLDDEEVGLEALQTGAQDYLVKGQTQAGLLVRSLRYAIERQRAEVALRSAHAQLEDRVAERARELTRTNEELLRAVRDRERAEELARVRHRELTHVARLNTLGEMASSLAHELNQPLTAIVAYTRSCLRRMAAGWERPEVRDELESELAKAANEARRGADIISRLRRLVSKRDSQPEACDVNQSIRDVADLVGAELRAAKVRLHLHLNDDLPTVVADRVQIEQVLINLVRNAVDAMANGGGDLQVRSARDLQKNIEVKVIDSGIGADTETLGRLFEPFVSSKHEGLGLGLSISRTIIESHRGVISVAPNIGPGLTFRFTLPMDPKPSDSASSSNAEDA